MLKVFKFGGASVKDANSVKNVAEIIRSYKEERLVVIVSAMGKTTNAFEEVLSLFFNRSDKTFDKLEEIKQFHFQLCKELFQEDTHPIFADLHNTFVEAEWQLEDDPVGSFDFEYDQLIGLGEQLSTKIVAAYLAKVGLYNRWLDARDVIRTDNTYRKANIDWNETDRLIQDRFTRTQEKIIVSQGFVGSTSENFTTTLGREGSDFSAAIFASVLNAEEVIIWKDVDGMLNADPKYYSNTIKLDNISYKEAVELAYFGASVIHPKTIKPLQNKKIPLYVKSFLHPEKKGSLINQNSQGDANIPSYIHKENQVLISISSKDYAFMDEIKLAKIFTLFSSFGLTVNIMQNSAISFSVALDYQKEKVDQFMSVLKEEFLVSYNLGATLITVRHFTEKLLINLLKEKTILMEQKTRSTARFVLI